MVREWVGGFLRSTPGVRSRPGGVAAGGVMLLGARGSICPHPVQTAQTYKGGAMTAWKRLAGVLLTGATAALVTGVSAGAAAGVDATWTVTPGGSITLASSAIALRDNVTGTTLSCTASSGSGGIGSSIDNVLGTITALSFTGCTGPQGQPFTITMTRLPFYISGKIYNATAGVTSGIIYRVAGELSGPSCTASLEGPDTIHTARPRFSYRNSTGKLKLPGTGTMEITNVTGCTGLFNNGPTPDPASLTGTYTVTPKQTITSP